ncbi:MAG: hypothetical protein ABIY52_02900 [Gemmatimonadaceae bacterium]
MGIGIGVRWLFAAAVVFAPPIDAQAVRPGTGLEVITAARTVRGKAVATTPANIIVGNDTIPRADIISWRSRSTHAGAGAKSGAIGGGITFTLLGAAAGAGLCDANCDNASLHGAGAGALFGVVAGAAFGAFVGSLIPRWTDQAKGTTPVVKQSPLTTFPIKLYASQGRVLDARAVSQGGLQFARNDWRLGIEAGRVGEGSTNIAVFQSPTDPRLRSFTEIIRSTNWLGIAAERRVVGIVWLTASALNRQRHETTLVNELGSVDDSRYPLPIRSSFTAPHSAFGGSVGLAARHRVFDDVYLRIDARQELGPWSNRTWSVGIEL